MWPFNKPVPVEAAAAAPVEAKSSGTAVPEDWLLELFGAPVAGSIAVSASVAMTVPAVANAVRLLSESAATLDVTVKRKVGNEEVDVPDHPAAQILNGRVNPWTSSYELIRDITAEALTRDAGGFAWVNRVNGRIAEIIKYTPGTIGVEYDPKGTGEPTYRLNGKKLKTADVIHLRGPFDRCPLSLARDAIGAAKAMEIHAANLFKNGARPGGVIETPAKLGDTGVKAMIRAWRAAHDGTDNAGKTAILWEGAKFNPLAMTSTDAEFLQNRNFQIAEIARAFSLPQHMLGKLDRATWSNMEQASREYITYALLPWLRALEAALGRSLLTDSEAGEYRIAFDVDDTTQADLTARATAISTLITARVLNPNEARDWLGMPPRDGGNEFSNPAIDVKPANTNTPTKQGAAA